MAESIDKKIILIGEAGVGKTSIINQYIFEQFEEHNQQTLGAAFRTKLLPVSPLLDFRL